MGACLDTIARQFAVHKPVAQHINGTELAEDSLVAPFIHRLSWAQDWAIRVLDATLRLDQYNRSGEYSWTFIETSTATAMTYRTTIAKTCTEQLALLDQVRLALTRGPPARVPTTLTVFPGLGIARTRALFSARPPFTPRVACSGMSPRG